MLLSGLAPGIGPVVSAAVGVSLEQRDYQRHKHRDVLAGRRCGALTLWRGTVQCSIRFPDATPEPADSPWTLTRQTSAAC